MKSTVKINWLNTAFLFITPIVGIVGTLMLGVKGLFHWQTFVLAFILMSLGGLSITAGYHRLFSHVTYKTVWPVRLLYVLFGAATFEGSVLEWCTDHRNHHRYTDSSKDPYTVKQGFWHAHIGWLLTLDISQRKFDNVDDLKADKLVAMQHSYYVPIAIFMGFLLPMFIAKLWGDMLGGVIIAGALRITLVQHATFCINSVCHTFGKLTFSDRNTARDNWFTALFTFGEGYHNFHHRFPLDYRNGIRAYDFDPTKWLINSLKYLGMAKDLKMVSRQRIIQARIEMEHQHISQKIVNPDSSIYQSIQHLYKALCESLTNLNEIELAYRKLKASKIKYMKGRITEYKKVAREYSEQLSQLKHDLKDSLKCWDMMVAKVL